MKEQNKGGRPRKELNQKRKYQVNVKLMTGEYYFLKSLAKSAALPINDYVRQCIKSSSVMPRITPEENDLIRKLIGMANNLNQIAKKANQAGYNTIRTEYLFLADSIDDLIDTIRNDSKNNNRQQF
ncbi:hypothetical protein M2480_002923 [Parabacteroides sp. PFB2-12]|uniref:plasmid mobilization protein n=1 Tax=unclassified Parabacteroides TaxID=2649774 RepID=UPI00247481FD|nr:MULTISPECIES: plasmid mobilization relaxosome protein MobC [unclassified Parabacteroides]MDH6343758.1 hypothetical protein [Parabacteroides sp. PM6-13]MDH6391920.1 hypothetical protein [Parabacteroides sp. PFB2-12]